MRKRGCEGHCDPRTDGEDQAVLGAVQRSPAGSWAESALAGWEARPQKLAKARERQLWSLLDLRCDGGLHLHHDLRPTSSNRRFELGAFGALSRRRLRSVPRSASALRSM
jgi:hypothetical protein